MTSEYPQIRFGVLAVEKGIISAGQLGKAVSIQMNEDLKGMKHRFLGQILLDLGYMTQENVDELLNIT